TQLARELTRQGHPVRARTVGRLLRAAGHSLQNNWKSKEGASKSDRNSHCDQHNGPGNGLPHPRPPHVQCHTDKKHMVGDFKNGRREWQPQGEPTEVVVHDFLDKTLGKAIPYGVYDVTQNQGWVSVGIDHDTARFAARAIRRWWQKMGSKRHRGARELL